VERKTVSFDISRFNLIFPFKTIFDKLLF
jgi:hypothetical protein